MVSLHHFKVLHIRRQLEHVETYTGTSQLHTDTCTLKVKKVREVFILDFKKRKKYKGKPNKVLSIPIYLGLGYFSTAGIV